MSAPESRDFGCGQRPPSEGSIALAEYDGKRYLAVAGECPEGCGRTLFLGSGGHVTCSWIDCPNPAAADELLHRTPSGSAATQKASPVATGSGGNR